MHWKISCRRFPILIPMCSYEKRKETDIMNLAEQELFWSLCKFLDPDRERIKDLLQEGAGTPAVLGQLLYNRMGGVAYQTIYRTETAGYAPREFRNALRDAWQIGKDKNKSYARGRSFVSEILEKSGAEYVLLKGAYLCDQYPPGCRTANDVDVLTQGKWVTQIGNALRAAGFLQGAIRNGVFTPANRQEILQTKMMRGETVPYFLEVDFPYMQYLEVDINFSLDYKNTADTALPAFLSDFRMRGTCRLPSPPHFLLHLCTHLYKEAATYPWVQMRRDMSLYKFCDLYFLLYAYTLEDYGLLLTETKKYDLTLQCYYALEMMRALFQLKDPMLLGFLARITPPDPDVLDRVLDPAGKKEYRYAEKDVRRRFFEKDRLALLKEVCPDAQR